MNDRNYRAVIAGVGIMWITMLASLYYHTARLEAQIRVWEDSVVQQLDALKHDIRLSSERREGRYASVLHDVRGALAHRSPVARQARLTAAGQVGASVARLERSLSLQGASTEAKLDALKAERAMDARVRSLQDLAAQRLREVEQTIEFPLERPCSRPPLPCLLTRTTTKPSFRLCTLDPDTDSPSKHLHTSGALPLSRKWPLPALMKAHAGGGGAAGDSAPLFVDVGPSFGYFSLFAATLGARVIAYEEHADVAELLRASVRLNGLADRLTVRQSAVSDTAGVGVLGGADEAGDYPPVKFVTLDDEFASMLGDGDAASASSPAAAAVAAGLGSEVYVLRVSAEGHEPEVLRGAKRLLEAGRVAFLFVEVCPRRIRAQGGDPVAMLAALTDQGYNVFDDARASQGALQRSELGAFVDSIADSVLVFAALAED